MAEVHPTAVVDKSVQLADSAVIGPNCVLEKNVSIGDGTTLDANVVIGRGVSIGKNNRIFPNCVIGREAQTMGHDSDKDMGKVAIGDNNMIREFVTIHSSMFPDGVTTIGNDNLFMVGTHIGHDSMIEDKIVFTNCIQVAGHCKIETGAWLSGMVAIHQFVTIGKWTYTAGLAGLSHDFPPFVTISGHYPPRVRGINKRGLNRAGIGPEQQEVIVEAYRKLYRQNGNLLENAETLASRDDLDENVRDMVNSIINSGKQRFGRYLEMFRRDH